MSEEQESEQQEQEQADDAELSNTQLMACLRAGISPPAGTEDVIAWMNENVAWTNQGEPVLTTPQGDGNAQEQVPEDGQEQAQEQQQPKLTENQKAVKYGNPKLPSHVNRAIMSPSVARSAIEDFDESRLPDADYRKELWNEFERNVDPRQLKRGLAERTEALLDTGEFDGIREIPLGKDFVTGEPIPYE